MIDGRRARPSLAFAVTVAAGLAGLAGLGAGCAAARPAVSYPFLATGIQTMQEDGALETRHVDPLAAILTNLGRPLTDDEPPLAHAVARGLLDRIPKKRQFGVPACRLADDLDAAAKLHGLAPDLFDAGDIALFVEGIDRLHAPANVAEFIAIYTGYGLPRSADASAAIIATVGGNHAPDGILEELFCHGFRIEDATLRSYAESIVADRFAVEDLIFAIRRIAADDVVAKLPAFAERLMAWVESRSPEARGAEARRRIYHNAVIALRHAKERGVRLPGAIFDRWVLPGAARPDIDVDDLAAAYEAFGRPTRGLLEARLAALRGARATQEALVELIEVAALMREQDHPRAADALELAQRAVERPPGLDERIGARTAGRPYSDYAVRRLTERLSAPLRAATNASLYCGYLAGLLTEQGEVELAHSFAGPHLARK